MSANCGTFDAPRVAFEICNGATYAETSSFPDDGTAAAMIPRVLADAQTIADAHGTTMVVIGHGPVDAIVYRAHVEPSPSHR